MAKFRSEQEALGKVVGAGIRDAAQQAAVREREAKARAYLGEARKLFDAAGLPAVDDLAVLREYVAVLRLLGDDDLAADPGKLAAYLNGHDGFTAGGDLKWHGCVAYGGRRVRLGYAGAGSVGGGG